MSESAKQAALELLAGTKSAILTGHVRPDGDCIGAQAALARVLAARGAKVHVLNPDPVEGSFDYLAREVEFSAWKGGELPAHDLVVLLDCNDLERTGALAQPLGRAPSKKLVVDHHVEHGDPWWDAAYVDVSAAATGLLVHRIARELGVRLDPVAAAGVFTSIVTDTGWFKYSNTDAETLAVASELVGLGVEPYEVYGAIYQRASRDHPRAIARALSNLEYHEGGRLASIALPAARAGEPELADSDDVLDLVRAVGAVEVVLILREQPDGVARLSARSKTGFDVERLARRFGGGGHKKAAGATLQGPLAAARERLLAAAVEELALQGAAGKGSAER